jgi:3-phenylpropionate/trans-cinnamate dioxygenase ferredoxin subunit
MSGGEFVKAGPASKFPEGRPSNVNLQGKSICLVNDKGRFFAFDDQCTHAEAQLSMGELEEGEIVCPLHGARFSIQTGEPMTLPAVRPVQTYEVKVEANEVWVRL